jgi:hypothetical protein
LKVRLKRLASPDPLVQACGLGHGLDAQIFGQITAALFVSSDGQRPVAVGHIGSLEQAVGIFPTGIGGDDFLAPIDGF